MTAVLGERTGGSILLAFVGTDAAAHAYGAAFARLRWRRAAGTGARVVELDPASPAAAAFGPESRHPGIAVAVAVLDPEAIPVAFPERLGDIPPALAAARLCLASTGSPAHTPRELEEGRDAFAAAPDSTSPSSAAPAPAVAFLVERFPPAAGETVADLLRRVLAAAVTAAPDGPAGFAALMLADPSDAPRPELASRFPGDRRRLADVGCGRGATAADLRARIPGLAVTGIESSPRAATAARERLDRVLEGDAAAVLSALAASGERFDAFLLGDVLEHTSDPVAVLGAAREAAEPDAVLVASVPNAGHLSVVRDLVLGRFDPAPAGLMDAGHLRWFTRPFLEEALEEAGWLVESIEGIPGAAPRDAEAFRASLPSSADAGALGVYQWIAVARPRPLMPGVGGA